MEHTQNESLLASLPAAALSSTPCARSDGWTPDRQRGFLAAIAEGHTVEAAAAHVGMSPRSAYNLRTRAAGAGFALGWQAANLLARERLADALVSRALDGITETWTRGDGAEVTRHRHDNRLGMAMLSRLDRLADNQAAEGTHHAARVIAQEFEAYLDLIEKDGGPASAGLFLGVRARAAETGAELAAIVSLARADRFVRAGAGLPAEVDCADLDPASRAGWTAEQWLRAEAAGLVALAPAEEEEGHSGSRELSELPRERTGDDPVWWDEIENGWRTSFPPSEDFYGEEEGVFGVAGYHRALSDEEEEAIEASDAIARLRARGERDRDTWFAALAKEEEGEEVEDEPGTRSEAPLPLAGGVGGGSDVRSGRGGE